MTRKKGLVVIFVACLLVLLLVGPTPLLAEEQTTISANVVVNVREGPNLEEAIIGKLTINKDYMVLKEENDWIQIQFTDSSTGWVAAYLVSKNSNSAMKKEATIQEKSEAIVTEDGLRLRKGPGTSYQVISTLTQGTKVTLIASEGEWVNILTSFGKGWVHKDFVGTSNTSLPSQENTTKSNPTQKNELTNSQLATVLEDQINVRSNPSTTATIIGKLAKNTALHVVKEESDWAKIEYSGNTGWVHRKFLEYSSTDSKGKQINKQISIQYDQTNIRKEPSVSSPIIKVAAIDDTFLAVEQVNNWYKIELSDGEYGYVADWIVQEKKTNQIVNNSSDLKGKIIVLDPGHGGKDSGTIGSSNSLEKNLTINTALLLGKKLESAGAKVVLTRTDDTFITLQNRVAISQSYKADAFISIHYDSNKDAQISGITSYYYSADQKALANSLHKSIIEATNMVDRGLRKNNYFVLRENSQPASLLELGFLSNPSEEKTVGSKHYQETISTAIYQGIQDYFDR